MYTTDGRDTRETVTPYQGYSKSFDICPMCGKPAIYVGDYFGGIKPWCTCSEDTKQITDNLYMGLYTSAPDEPLGAEVSWADYARVPIALTNSTDYGLSEGVSCALPDLRYVFYIGLGAVVVAAALVMRMLRRK